MRPAIKTKAICLTLDNNFARIGFKSTDRGRAGLDVEHFENDLRDKGMVKVRYSKIVPALVVSYHLADVRLGKWTPLRALKFFTPNREPKIANESLLRAHYAHKADIYGLTLDEDEIEADIEYMLKPPSNDEAWEVMDRIVNNQMAGEQS